MEAPKWEDIEPYMYADYVYLKDLMPILNGKLYKRLDKYDIRMDEEGLKIIQKICFDVLGMHPKIIEIPEKRIIHIEI